MKAPVSSFQREQPSDCEDHTADATLAFPVGNYVSADLRIRRSARAARDPFAPYGSLARANRAARVARLDSIQ